MAEVRKTDSYAYAYVDEFGSSSCKSSGPHLKDYFHLNKYIEDSNGQSRFINNFISDGIKKVVLSSFKNGMTFSQAQKYFELPDEFLKEIKEYADFTAEVRKRTKPLIR